MKRILFLLAIVGLFTVACSKDNEGTENTNPTEQPGAEEEEEEEEEKEPQLELSQQSMNVGFESGSYSITVTSPFAWSATSDNNWIVVESSTGIAGIEELSFRVERSVVESVRKGTIFVKNADRGLYAEFYVIQNPLEPELKVATTQFNFTAQGGTQLVEVVANFDYDITTTVDWITCEKCAEGVNVVVSENFSLETRTTEIEFGSDKFDVVPITIYLEQEAADGNEIQFGGGFIENATRAQFFDLPYEVWASVDNKGCVENVFDRLYVEYIGGEWDYDQNYVKYWTENSVYNFEALVNAGDSVIEQRESDGMLTSLCYNVSDQSDLLYAKETIYTTTNDADLVTFTFKHLLSQVYVRFTNRIDNPDCWINVSSIGVKVADNAVVNFGQDGCRWDNHSGQTTISLGGIDRIDAGYNGVTEVCYVIPQEGATITISCDLEAYNGDSSINTTQREVNVSFPIDMGKVYVIELDCLDQNYCSIETRNEWEVSQFIERL